MERSNSSVEQHGALRELPPLNGLSYCQIACGTSQAFAFSALELGQLPDADEVLCRIACGRDGDVGLAGEHYQHGKFVVVGPLDGPHSLAFRFLQVDRRAARLAGQLECANVAAAAAVFALALGAIQLDVSGCLSAVNLGTGQVMKLAPDAPRKPHAANWTVRFIYGPGEFQQGALWHDSLADRRGPVEYWLVDRGNIFAFINAPSERVDDELLASVSTLGERFAASTPTPDRKPKVVVFDWGLSNDHCVDAVCFYDGQRHHSFPGSAAMCLAGLLTLVGLQDEPPPAPAGAMRIGIRHPAGILNVDVSWEFDGWNYHVCSTEFATPVRLMTLGQAILQ